MSPVLSPKPTPSESQASVEVIRCGLDDEVYCLEMSEVGSVMPVGDLRPADAEDDSPQLGVMEYQGQNVPVYDLATLLGRPSKPPERGHYIVVIEHPIERYGLRVDSVSRVIRIVPENVMPLPKPLEHTRRWYRGIVDFSRDRKINPDWRAERHLPGICAPREKPVNRRQADDQMKMLLNPRTLLWENPKRFGPDLPAEYLLRRYTGMAAIAQPRRSRQLVVFPVGVKADCPLLMGLSISQVAEITEPLTTISVPGANPNVSGFAQWRSCPVPILNLQATLDCEPTNNLISHWIIAREHQTQGLVALPVSGRIQSLRLPIDYRPCPLPVASWSKFVLGTFEYEACVLLLPRLDALSVHSGDF